MLLPNRARLACSASPAPQSTPADRSHDYDTCRYQARRFEITPIIARRGTEHGSGLGIYRRVVEGAIALLHSFRRLRIYWEIRDGILQTFAALGAPASVSDG